MSKSKPSSWQPRDLGALRGFKDLYPDDVRQTIVEAMPENIGKAARDTLLKVALVIAAEVYAARHLADRATIREINAGLSDLQDKAKVLGEALSSLDHDSRSLLHQVAEPEDEVAIVEPYGDIALAKVARQIEKLQRWCGEAMDGLEEPRPGPKPDDAVKAAMIDLADAWKNASGNRPSSQSIADFAFAVLSPVVGEDTDFDWHWRRRTTV